MPPPLKMVEVLVGGLVELKQERPHCVPAADCDISIAYCVVHRLGRRTRGSVMTPRVCTSTTLCTNLMQQIRTPAAAVSHLFKMFDLIADIFPHVIESCGLDILAVNPI